MVLCGVDRKKVELVDRLKEYLVSTTTAAAAGDGSVSKANPRQHASPRGAAAKRVSLDTAVQTPLPARPGPSRASLGGGGGKEGGGSATTAQQKNTQQQQTKTKTKKTTKPAPEGKSRKRQTQSSTVTGPGGKRGLLFLALIVAVVAAALVAVPYYCDADAQGNCVGKVLERVRLDAVVDKGQKVYGNLVVLGEEAYGYAVKESMRAYGYAVTQSVRAYRAGEVHVRAGVKVVQKKVEEVLDSLEEAKKSMENKKHVRDTEDTAKKGFNTSVLEDVWNGGDGPEWKGVKHVLYDVWSQGQITEHKANALLLTCSGAVTCNAVVEKLMGVASPEAVLTLDLGAMAEEHVGELQGRLASFLSSYPAGAVILPNVQHMPVKFLTVVNNALGESGAFQDNGKNVKCSEATFFMTMDFDMVADDPTTLTREAKAHLVKSLGFRAAGSQSEEGTSFESHTRTNFLWVHCTSGRSCEVLSLTFLLV